MFTVTIKSTRSHVSKGRRQGQSSNRLGGERLSAFDHDDRCRSGRTVPSCVIATWMLLSALVWGGACGVAFGADEDVNAKPVPLGRFVDLASPVDDTVIRRVKTVALEMKAEAAADDRDAVLVLTIPTGTSQFHHVFALANLLNSSDFAGIKTVGWVPETVTGYNAMLAFACRDLVMHPDAELGDFGRGEALSDDEQAFASRIAKRRGNALRPAALAEAMGDPAEALFQVDLEKAAEAVAEAVRTERRLVLKVELEQLQDVGVVIRDTRTISEAGSPLVLSTEEAMRIGALTSRTALETNEVADLFGLPLEAMRTVDKTTAPTKVRKIPVTGEIDMLLGSFLSRQIERAANEGADLIIFEIDSPGGLKWVSQDLADRIAELSERNIRTVAWIPNMALSGAAIISLGCDEIVLAPTAKIGDAGAIRMNGDGVFERAPEKVLSPFRVDMAHLAERKGRPPAILMAMVDVNLEVFEVKHAVTGRTWYMTDEEIHNAAGEWIKGRLVEESRKEDLLLTADGDRAHELKIAEPPAKDFAELKTRLGIPGDLEIREVERTWVDDFVVVLNQPFITMLLFFVGILCIYIELHTMTGFFGIGAVLCFSLFFWSKMLGGTAGALEVVLFVLGFLLIACEIFVFPGFGVSGVTGFLLIVASLVMASQTFQGLSAEQSLAASGSALAQLGGALVGVIITGALLSRFLPKIPIFADMILTPPGNELPNGTDVRLRPELTDAIVDAGGPAIGTVGQSATTLRPAGKVRIDGSLFDVMSEGSFIESGRSVEVVEYDGKRIVVREVMG